MSHVLWQKLKTSHGPHLQEQWIGYVLVCCFGIVFTAITMSMLW